MQDVVMDLLALSWDLLGVSLKDVILRYLVGTYDIIFNLDGTVLLDYGDLLGGTSDQLGPLLAYL
jgi:hypothetical protein